MYQIPYHLEHEKLFNFFQHIFTHPIEHYFKISQRETYKPKSILKKNSINTFAIFSVTLSFKIIFVIIKTILRNN